MQLKPEYLLAALYDTLPDPVLIVDDERMVVAANAAATEKFGYSNAEFTGMFAVNLYASAADAKDVGAELYPLSSNSKAIHRRLNLKRKDGSVFPTELTISRIESAEGEGLGSVAIIRDLSEIYKAQEDRLRAETILNTALDSISQGFVVYDEHDRLVICNEAQRQIYSISDPAMQVGNTFESILRYGLEHGQFPVSQDTPEAQEVWIQQRLAHHNNPGATFTQEISPDRTLLVEERLTDQNFRVGLRTDVSVLSQTRNEAERLGRIIESVEQEVYLISLDDNKIISANKSARDNLQYSMEELRQINPLDLNAGHTSSDIAKDIAPILSGEKNVLVTETQHRRKDGSTYFCRVRLELLDDTSERVVLAFVEDITGRIEIERALERKEAEFQMLVRNLPDFITRAKPDTTLTYVNENYARFIGLEADEMIGRKFLDFIAEDYRGTLLAHISSLSLENPMKTSEQVMETSSGEQLWFLWSNLMVFENGEPVELVSVGRDINDVREAQTRIANQSRALEMRNDALEQFSGIVSHDLKAPLRQIRLFADMIAEDISAGRSEDLAAFSGYISERSESMERMISNLLEYSQLAYQRINHEHFQLSDAVAAAWENLAVNVGETRARLISETDIAVYADRYLLTQLFQNLFANSLKYCQADQASVIRVTARAVQDGVEIFAEDNGIGIDPSQSERIFGVFQRLHPDQKLYSGTGIGLALCRRIAESHDGSIVLDSTYQGGARFTITLPLPAKAT
ncbi:PAS domain S-box protein [Hoeflea sp. AS60]|uniref:PAS domain-containing sensor histidine kinase n=1 Tax=Hoeflea sp. AS60 TaxID=3135780 RepID=UPI0031818AD4